MTRQSPLNVFEEFFFSAKSVVGEIFFLRGIKWDLTRQLPSSRQGPNGQSQHFSGPAPAPDSIPWTHSLTLSGHGTRICVSPKVPPSVQWVGGGALLVRKRSIVVHWQALTAPLYAAGGVGRKRDREAFECDLAISDALTLNGACGYDSYDYPSERDRWVECETAVEARLVTCRYGVLTLGR